MSAIVLLPIGNTDTRTVGSLQGPLNRAFGVPVVLDRLAIDLEKFYDERRVQYNSTALIGHLLEQVDAGSNRLPEKAKMLAVVSVDLFIPILTFVFGEAQLGGRIAVVSYHRLANERYGLPSQPQLLTSRLEKEAVHELGHLYGLVHCSSYECVMHTSTYVEDIDMKPARFCDQCQSLLTVPAAAAV